MQSGYTIAGAVGCRIGGEGIVALGEMDVAQVKPKPQPGGKPPVQKASLLPAVAANFREAIWDRPLTWWMTSTRPGLRRASGMEMTCGEDEKMDRMLNRFPRALVCSCILSISLIVQEMDDATPQSVVLSKYPSQVLATLDGIFYWIYEIIFVIRSYTVQCH